MHTTGHSVGDHIKAHSRGSVSDYVLNTKHLTKKFANVTIVVDLFDLLTLQSSVNSSRKKGHSAFEQITI